MAEQRSGKKGEGFQSAAGLIRYFDAEDETALKIDPKWVIGLCVMSVVVVLVFQNVFPV